MNIHKLVLCTVLSLIVFLTIPSVVIGKDKEIRPVPEQFQGIRLSENDLPSGYVFYNRGIETGVAGWPVIPGKITAQEAREASRKKNPWPDRVLRMTEGWLGPNGRGALAIKYGIMDTPQQARNAAQAMAVSYNAFGGAGAPDESLIGDACWLSWEFILFTKGRAVIYIWAKELPGFKGTQSAKTDQFVCKLARIVVKKIDASGINK